MTRRSRKGGKRPRAISFPFPWEPDKCRVSIGFKVLQLGLVRYQKVVLGFVVARHLLQLLDMRSRMLQAQSRFMTNPYHIHIDRRCRPNLTFGRTKEYLSERAHPLPLSPYNSNISSAITVAIMNRRRVRGGAAKRPSVRRPTCIKAPYFPLDWEKRLIAKVLAIIKDEDTVVVRTLW